MACLICNAPHGPQAACPRLQQLGLSLNLFAVPAFLTDPLNRFIWVNREFAHMVGDPIRDRVPSNMRFVDAAILGPYRDRFPQGKQQVAQCISSLFHEVEAGRLAVGALHLLEEILAQDDDLRRAAHKSEATWDGTVVIKDNAGKLSMVREQVVPVADTQGRTTGLHISLWLPVEKNLPTLEEELVAGRSQVASQLTPRQLEIARWYAAGLTSKEVALKAVVTPGTARAHLEEIYSRLDVHSRAELAVLLVREGLA